MQTTQHYLLEMNEAIRKLEKDTLLLSKWFSINVMKLNEDKYHLLTFGAKDQGVTINNGIIEELESE